MNTFPLARTKWSNEKILAGVFAVLLLYLLPEWSRSPGGIRDFAVVLAVGLVIDAGANFIRYQRPICAASAGVTAAVLQVLTAGAPLWGRLLGISFALLPGKHFQGGTGKNIFNPALTGLLFMRLLLNIQPHFHPTPWLLPALILSLPFLKVRPFAAIGFMAGTCAALLSRQEWSVFNLIAYEVVFWGCLVLTDPVTITEHPHLGAWAGFLSGFISLQFSDVTPAMTLSVLIFNLLSFVMKKNSTKAPRLLHSASRLKKVVPFISQETNVFDLAGARDAKQPKTADLPTDEILNRIQRNEVVGFGGAGFPTHAKIKAVIGCKNPHKHLIINGVECDPGLIHDQWLLRAHPEEISRGIAVLRQCIRFDSVTLAVKEASGLNFPEELKIYRVPDYYPAGAEKLLIKEILGKPLPAATIPAQEGILVLNAQTVYAIFEAVAQDLKADTRFLTVVNLKAQTGMVARVKLGTKVRKVLEAVSSGSRSDTIFCGGGLMQCHLADDTEVVERTTNLIALADWPRYKESPLCSNCGLCVSNCPMGLKVNRIAQMAGEENFGKLEKYHVENCLNCGTCSYVCLAGRNLASRMRVAKAHLRN